MADDPAEFSPLELATELTVAWLSNPNTRASAEEVPTFLERMHAALRELRSSAPTEGQSEPAQEYAPAVTARKSLASPEHILSMIDGKPYKSLKRHLSKHGLTPAQYRDRYGLKSDYPMVAPVYAERRRELAKEIGLGRKPGERPARSSPGKVGAGQAGSAAIKKMTNRKPSRRASVAQGEGATDHFKD